MWVASWLTFPPFGHHRRVIQQPATTSFVKEWSLLVGTKKEGWFNKNRFRQLKVRLRSFTTLELCEGGARHHTTPHHSPHPGLVHSCWGVSWNQSFTALLYLANPPLYVVVNDHFRFLLVSQSCLQFVPMLTTRFPFAHVLWPRDGEDEKLLAAGNRLATTGYLCFNYNWVLLSAAALHLVLLVWSGLVSCLG